MSEAKPLKREKCETYDAGYSKEDLMPKKDSQNPRPQPYEIGKWYLIENPPKIRTFHSPPAYDTHTEKKELQHHDDDSDDFQGDIMVLLFGNK